eukprot:g10500.t1
MATSFRVLAQRSRKRLKTRKAQEVVQATLARRRRARYFDLWAQVFEMESSSFFASQILGRGKLKRILDRWKQHTTFHAGFASQVLKTLQQSNLQRLQRAFRGWQERLHLRRLVAGMWLFRRRSWINAVFMAWNDEAVKAASTRRHLRSFFQAVRYSKASRAGSLQRKRVHGRLTGKVFRAYATWVKRAKVIQACRVRWREIFRAWLVQARRKKALTWASRSLAADTVRHAYTEGLQNLRSWAVFRRTLRQMVAGRRSTLLSSVLYCWVAALMPARHAAGGPQRGHQRVAFDAQESDEENAEVCSTASAAETSASLSQCLYSVDFAYMFLLFCSAIGFSFSFLNCLGRLAAEASVSGTELSSVFGLVNAFGRLLVCLPLDYTRNYRWGGIYVYIFLSLSVYILGLLLLALPSHPGAFLVRVANIFASLGYGGLLGIVPPALRVTFGTQHLGIIYGLLYVGVAVFEPLWGLLFQKPQNCSGVECYNLYTRTSAGTLLVTLTATWAVLRHDQRLRLLRPRAGQPAPRPAQQWKLSLVPPPAARAGDGQVVYLGLSKLATLDAIRFETPYDKLRQWGARDQSDTPSLEEEGALEQLRSDLMSHSTTVPCYRYKGSARVWDAIRENANQQCVKMRRALEAAMAQKKELPNLEEMLANLERQRLPLTPPPEDPERPLYLTCVVLLYVSPCNPLNLENIMMLRRARESVEAFHRVVVPGAVVIPYSTNSLQKHFEGEKPAVQLPFDFRLEMADAVIQTSEQEWILTDNCCWYLEP